MTYTKRAAAMILSLALSGAMGATYAQTSNNDMRKADAAQAKADAKANAKQAKADKARKKELKSDKAEDAAKAQDKANAEQEKADSR